VDISTTILHYLCFGTEPKLRIRRGVNLFFTHCAGRRPYGHIYFTNEYTITEIGMENLVSEETCKDKAVPLQAGVAQSVPGS
jgi:hypothetical protein